MGHAVGDHCLVHLKKVLDEALNKHVVLAKIALEVDHLVQDLLVVGLDTTQSLGHIIVSAREVVNLGLKALDSTGILDGGTLG